MTASLVGFARRAAAASLLASTASADVRYVDDDAAGGKGSSWPDAFNDLQQALVAALPGDEIRVAQGVYTPAPPQGDRSASFGLLEGVTILGGYAGVGAPNPDARDVDRFPTILSGDLNGDDQLPGGGIAENSFRVVVAIAVDATAVLDGATVTAGHANDPSHNAENGAGAYLLASSPAFIDCRFTDNQATKFGGAVYANGGAPSFSGCAFAGNSAVQGGGALYLASGQLELNACECSANTSGGPGGALYAAGGAFFARDTAFADNDAPEGGALYLKGGTGFLQSATLVGCRFLSNTAAAPAGHTGGGAIYNDVMAPMVVNCLFAGNTAPVAFGGALFSYIGGGSYSNCVFTGNLAGGQGGTAYSDYSILAFDQCTIVANSAQVTGGIVVGEGSYAALSNSILWGNIDASKNAEGAQVGLIPSGSVFAHHCCVQGYSGSYIEGESNFDADPLLLDPDGPDGIIGTGDDNVRLGAGSPCLDAGDADALPADGADLDEDGDLAEPLPLDLDLHARVLGATVDVGAYEAAQPGDINADGSVDILDLLALLGAWGPCPAPPGSCAADIDHDGAVNILDFLIVLANWS